MTAAYAFLSPGTMYVVLANIYSKYVHQYIYIIWMTE
jgi:hypothetical protein